MTEAFVTLATNDEYVQGALVLGYSLREVNTSKRLHVLISEQVTSSARQQLSEVFDDISVVDVLQSGDDANLALIGRPDLALTFTKLHCWRLTQYTKAVFLDADTLVLRNVDELFVRDEFSAAPDIGWPDFFNSGVFVFRPNEETYRSLMHHATTQGSFDGADQGLLNSYFSGWRESSSAHRLPFIYNVTGGIFYTYAAAYNKLKDQVKIVHFIGTQKPWRGGSGLQLPEFSQRWHEIHRRHVLKQGTSAQPHASGEHYELIIEITEKEDTPHDESLHHQKHTAATSAAKNTATINAKETERSRRRS